MKRVFQPKKSAGHRIASIALFRALLRQSAAVAGSNNDAQRIALQNIVRNKFRANQHVQSKHHLTFAFHAGYEALDILLDASANGDSDSKRKIENYLSLVPSHLAAAPQPKSNRRQHASPLDVACRPASSKVLDMFPRPSVVGVRKVPTLVNANGVPFLRYGKQPANLSRVIRQKINARQALLDRHYEMVDRLAMAEAEDQWDKFIRENAGYKESSGEEEGGKSSWAAEMRAVVDELKEVFFQRSNRNAEVAARMQRIVELETEVAEKERLERERLAGE